MMEMNGIVFSQKYGMDTGHEIIIEYVQLPDGKSSEDILPVSHGTEIPVCMGGNRIDRKVKVIFQLLH